MTATNTLLPSLRSVEDSDWLGAWGPDQNHLDRLRGYLTDGRSVWWRRDGFHKPQFREVEPKWHIFNGRTRVDDPDNRWAFDWHALCGYTNERQEILSGVNTFKVAAPKKDTRCLRCEAALKSITTPKRVVEFK